MTISIRLTLVVHHLSGNTDGALIVALIYAGNHSLCPIILADAQGA